MLRFAYAVKLVKNNEYKLEHKFMVLSILTACVKNSSTYYVFFLRPLIPLAKYGIIPYGYGALSVCR